MIAALVVTAIAIPESLGFAIIVGLPVQAGLYCALLAPVMFALFTSSKRLVVGADSATAALVASGAGSVALVGTAAYGNAIAVLGLVTAMVLLAMSVARFGFMADLISKPVLIGFLSGVGVQLIVGKLPEMLGLHAHGGLLSKIGYLATNIAQINITAGALAVIVVVVAVVASKFRLPGTLIGLSLAIAATKMLHLPSFGIEVVGIVPAGLPSLRLPSIDLQMVIDLIPPAFSIAVVILAQSLAVIRSSAARHEEMVDDNRDLLALGLANATSALVGGFAINGSPPRTSASEMAGGRTQLVNVLMAGCIGLVLVMATGLFSYVPTAALAAIVFTIGLHLIKLRELRDIFVMRRSEFAVALAALSGVALLGVQRGVMLAVLMSLAERLHREYHPLDEILLLDQEYVDWAADRLRGTHGQLQAPVGILIYRFSDSLFFENAGYFLKRVNSALSAAKEPVKTLILDAGAISDIDYSASQVLGRLYSQLVADDITLGIAHVSPSLRSLLSGYGLIDLIGPSNVFPSVAAAVENYGSGHVTCLEKLRSLNLPVSEYVVIGGGVMELLGIRETNDVDLVVSKSVYQDLEKKNWKEYVQDDGKNILTKDGYVVMRRWMGRDLKDLRRTAFKCQGIPVMGLDDLVDCKTILGRRKDLEDVLLIRTYEVKHSQSRMSVRARPKISEAT